MNTLLNPIVSTLNVIGVPFCRHALDMFIQSSILIALLVGVDLLLRRWVRAVFRYCLWMLVLVKLVLFTSLSSPLSIGAWCGHMWSVRPAAPRAAGLAAAAQMRGGRAVLSGCSESSAGAAALLPAGVRSRPGMIRPESADAKQSFQAARKAAQERPLYSHPASGRSTYLSLSWQGYVFLAWCGGVLAMGALLLQRARFVKGLLRQAAEADADLVTTLADCRAEMNMRRRKVGLKLSPNMVGPAVCGLVRPIILLPSHLVNELDHEQLRCVLLHELAHVKRFDLIVNCIQTALQIVYFYNPMVWLANAAIRRVREQAVDEMVLVALGERAPNYSHTLVDIAEMTFQAPSLSLRLIGVVESKKSLSRRVKHILNRPVPKTAKLGVAGFAAVLAIGAVLLPMGRAEGGSDRKPRPLGSKGSPRASLQTQIDNASPGDTVTVPQGSHTGPLVITKPLTLRGQDAETCVVELLADQPAIYVEGTKDVRIENIKVRWSPKSTNKRFENPAAIAVRDATVVISGCHLEPIDRPLQTPYGLLAQGRSDVTFTRGSTRGFAYAIMFTDGANGAVSDSFLEGAGHCAVTMHAHSKVAVTRNILARCDYHAVRNTGGTVDMKSNLVIDNNRAGVYLGNKSAHGIVANNLFVGNRGAVWAYAQSDVKLINNIFINSQDAAVGFHATCKLRIEKNSFVNNPTGMIRYKAKDSPKGRGARVGVNHYWMNGKNNVDTLDEKPDAVVSGDPKFKDPVHGDYSVERGSALRVGASIVAGLSDPAPIKLLWDRWGASLTSDSSAKALDTQLLEARDKEALEAPQHRFVRLVVGPDKLTFEGKETSWEDLPALLDKVPDRTNTVLELAETHDLCEDSSFIAAYGKAVTLARLSNFKYASNIGKHMLGSRGTAVHEGKMQFDTKQPIKLIAGTAERPEAFEVESILFEQEGDHVAAGVRCVTSPGPRTRWRIRVSMHDGDQYQEKDIIYDTRSTGTSDSETSVTNLHCSFDIPNQAFDAERFRVSVEQIQLPPVVMFINSTLSVKSVDGGTTNVVKVLSRPTVSVLIGKKAEVFLADQTHVSSVSTENAFTRLKLEFMPEIEGDTVTLNGKLSISDVTNTAEPRADKKAAAITWRCAQGTETSFQINRVIPGKEYVISPIPYNEDSFLEIKLKAHPLDAVRESASTGKSRSTKLEGIGLTGAKSQALSSTPEEMTETIARD